MSWVGAGLEAATWQGLRVWVRALGNGHPSRQPASPFGSLCPTAGPHPGAMASVGGSGCHISQGLPGSLKLVGFLLPHLWLPSCWHTDGFMPLAFRKDWIVK